MSNPVLTERRDEILVITLNRPEALNAIDKALIDALGEAIALLDGDDGLGAGVLTGAGRGFSAGMDLKAFLRDGMPSGMLDLVLAGSAKPMVAAIEGFALAGGLELALTCDLLVAAEGAKLGIPEVKVGLFAAAGALARLPRRLPYGIALEMALTGAPITAERAYDLGLVNRVAPRGGAVDGAVELARLITANAPLGVAASKRLVQGAGGCTEAEFWGEQARETAALFGTADAIEGTTAFAEKRPPVWKGR